MWRPHHSSQHYDMAAHGRILNPYSIAYDQEEAQETHIPLPFNPQQRKLGVFAAVVLLLSFSCFSWVRSPAGKASGGYYSGAAQVEWNRLVSPEALEVIAAQQPGDMMDVGNRGLSGDARDRVRWGVEDGGLRGGGLRGSEDEEDEEDVVEWAEGQGMETATRVEVGEGELGSMGQGQEALLQHTANDYARTEAALVTRLVDEILSTQAPPPPLEAAGPMPSVEELERLLDPPSDKQDEGKVEEGKQPSKVAEEEGPAAVEAPAEERVKEEEKGEAGKGGGVDKGVEAATVSVAGKGHHKGTVLSASGGTPRRPEPVKAEEKADVAKAEMPVPPPADAELEPDLTRKLRVWLRADRGVNGPGDTTVTRMEDGAHLPVATWTSVTPGKKAEEAAEDSSVVFRALSGAAQQRSEKKWRDGVVQDRKMVEKGQAKDGRTRAAPPGMEDVSLVAEVVGVAGRTALRFPCALTAEGVQLKDGQTVFVVLSPSFLEKGDQVPGQRFLGHYPHGQLRFHNSMLSFKTESGDYSLEASGELVKEGQFVLAAYRFNSNVQMSVNGRAFEEVANERGEEGEPPVFSKAEPSPFLSVGGVDGDCGFFGHIAEVLVFDSVLGDDESSTVSQYLGHRYNLPVMQGGPAIRRKKVVAQQEARKKKGPSPGKGDKEGSTRGKEGKEKEKGAKKERTSLASSMYGQAGPGEKEGAEEEGEDGREEEPPPPAECIGTMPFEGSVEGFTPPTGAGLEDLQKWEDGLRDSKTRIRQYKGGGQALRDFIHKEVRFLERLRHRLFCRYALSGATAAK